MENTYMCICAMSIIRFIQQTRTHTHMHARTSKIIDDSLGPGKYTDISSARYYNI